MSWSKPALLILCLALLGPAGCGFEPLYGRPAPGAESAGFQAELAAVRVVNIPDRLGQQLRNALVTRLSPDGEPAAAKYTLSAELSETETSLGYRKDAQATLGAKTLVAKFILSDERGMVYAGTTMSRSLFDYLGPRYASVATERDATDRAIQDLADDIRTRVAMVLKGRVRKSAVDPLSQ